jgi:glucose/arabinose dehydrogenase
MKTFYLFLTVCFSAAPCLAAPTLQDPSLKVEEVVSGLSLPTTMAFIGPDDILVLQKDDGRVRRVIGGVLQPGEVLDVAVNSDSERGLLGIALHPDFETNHLVYLYYTESNTVDDDGGAAANRVYQYTWNDITSTLTLANTTPILDLPVTPGPNHDGGIITFGPDGKLYVINGDLNRNGQLQNFSGGPVPDDTSVIHRLNDDGSIPSDNPFFSLGSPMDKYYAYGIRNSFGMAFDSVFPHKLWDTENGPDRYDEINLVEPGFNSGWEKIMGPINRDPEGDDESDLFQLAGAHYADPKFSWRIPVGLTAIAFLDSTALGAQYEDDVFVSNINNDNLYRFQPNAARDGFILSTAGLSDRVADDGDNSNEIIFGTGFNGITDLKVGPDGLLYVLSLFEGTIYRISQVADAAPPDTIIDSGPSNPTNQTSAAFTFHSTESGSSFQCQLDNGGFSACTSGKSYSSLSDGGHSFQVRAIDGAGNTDPTPASFNWTIDATATDTIIDTGPSNPTDQTSAAFTFHSTESGSSFQCQLDNGGFSACTSGKSYSSLSDGGHSFQVRATDGAGNTDPTPASYDWTVDSTTQTPLSVGASSLPGAEVGVEYSADLSIGGGAAPYTVALVRGSLPSGLAPNSAGIGGVPRVAKKFVFTLRVTDQAGAFKTKQFTLNVLKSLDIGSTTLKRGRVGRPYQTTFNAIRGKKPYAWSLISGDLPAGLALGPGSGRITGTPSGAESQTFTVEVTDPLGGSKQKSFTLTIAP